VVACGEGRADEFSGDLQLLVAELVENALQGVCEVGYVVEPEHGPGPLNGVQSTKHLVHQVHVVGLASSSSKVDSSSERRSNASSRKIARLSSSDIT